MYQVSPINWLMIFIMIMILMMNILYFMSKIEKTTKNKISWNKKIYDKQLIFIFWLQKFYI